MNTRHVSILMLTLSLTGASALAAHAGLMDSVKKKLSEKASKKVEDKTRAADDKADQVLDGQSKPAVTESEGKTEKSSDAVKGAGKPAGAGEGKVSSVSTKFDFIPGDNVLFLDDFTGDDLGEFPARWTLKGGTFEVAEMEGERWARCVSTNGSIRMKGITSLPEFWTLEFDLYNEDEGAIALTMEGRTKDENQTWQLLFPYSSQNLVFRAGQVSTNTPYEGTATGRHHIALMGRGAAIKVYVDQQRMASMPDVTGGGVTAELDINIGSTSKPMIANVRFAEGCKPPKDMLAEGKLVTHGIRFATGSDVVMPESAPVLRQVAAYMQANPAVRLSVTGHTDNVGTAPANLSLSQRRAASVARVLSSEFGVAADRFTTDGKGDTQGIASNAKAEGRAMNRRVEFAKI